MSTESTADHAETADYKRVEGFVYEDGVSEFVFCANCDDGRCRPDGDSWVCANDCGRSYGRQP